MINRQIASAGRDFWGLGGEVGCRGWAKSAPRFTDESGCTTQVVGSSLMDACRVPSKDSVERKRVCVWTRGPSRPPPGAEGPWNPGSFGILPQVPHDLREVRKVLPELPGMLLPAVPKTWDRMRGCQRPLGE